MKRVTYAMLVLLNPIFKDVSSTATFVEVNTLHMIARSNLTRTRWPGLIYLFKAMPLLIRAQKTDKAFQLCDGSTSHSKFQRHKLDFYIHRGDGFAHDCKFKSNLNALAGSHLPIQGDFASVSCTKNQGGPQHVVAP